MTRSKTRNGAPKLASLGVANFSLAPHRYSENSFPLKALKLLLREVQAAEPSSSKKSGADLDLDEDDGVRVFSPLHHHADT